MNDSLGTAPRRAAPVAPVRWGILATGRIATDFARDLTLIPDAELVAVGSRRLESATAFAGQWGTDATRAHGSYQAVVDDPDVDVVYVATPHALHRADVRLALEAGKHVLCEKPLTLNAAEAEDLVALARAKGLFLMEAMWMACHPLIRHLRGRLAEGEFGTLRQVHADIGFRVERPPTDRLLDPALGGGVLLDMGVYPLTLAQLLLGEPAQQTAVATVADSGIDLDVVVAAQYSSGAVASLAASMTGWVPCTAALITDRGRLDLPSGFFHPTHATWTAYDDGAEREPQRIDVPADDPVIGGGLGNEAAHVMACLRDGLTESPWVPLDQTLALMRQMDRIRAQIGVRYAVDAG